jgi:hypothetical protein
LWKLLSNHLGRGLLTFWCSAHRLDLAIESIIKEVPELKIWKANVIELATCFRTSKNKTKLLHSILPDAKQFPRHHEVRFAEHHLQLIDAVLHNLDACLEVFKRTEETGERRDKTYARGFAHVWNDKQVWMTELMGDILEVFQVLQQHLQRDSVFISDVLICRDSALRKLRLMKSSPYPGKRESKSKFNINECLESEAAEPPNPSARCARVTHKFIPSMKRNAMAIRNEIILSAEQFLSERLNVEQEDVIAKMKEMLTTKSLNCFVQIAVSLSADLFPGSEGCIADDVCEQWQQLEAIPHLPHGSDVGCSLSV